MTAKKDKQAAAVKEETTAPPPPLQGSIGIGAEYVTNVIINVRLRFLTDFFLSLFRFNMMSTLGRIAMTLHPIDMSLTWNGSNKRSLFTSVT